MNLGFWPAVIMGLAGAGHCLGMCGSMMGAFALTVPQEARLGTLLLYNLGRVSAYALAGALVGALGAYVGAIGAPVLLMLRLVAALLLVMLALYLLRWHLGLLKLEGLGQYLWRYLGPLAKSFLPLQSPWRALPLGFLWGWLPCGLVYSALSWALLSGTATSGALSMVAFGLGTVPVMLATGLVADRAKALLAHPGFKGAAALLLLLMAANLLYTVWQQWSAG
ncbi:sulfite exporter TauE/SafE family protein [Gallaecimonas kandeliae]|uniref:sulfite exporter TauE/SafE family protein n=1 Tax=Gallaecimonas kandeliae TaxID=3029055 RepID=UPI0026477967|nr:sulfite exporter TauE/SafE family protein [Gallaecimonas kandeliae]WKE67325.1 sulfite exporter TauE/SafE family protein [Gallaecimonas kandeliae]